ncbi:MAG: hypothetical protein JOZ72_10100 [Alphaproteobacteria bacterium]|nr:hypothetical protein [Alphaproteobacteria bacterium]
MGWLVGMTAAEKIALFTSFLSAGFTVAMAVWTYASQRDLEELKGRIARTNSLEDAKQEYEFEARKRLYAQIEPLLFQLTEIAFESYYRVVSLVRSKTDLGRGPDSWVVEKPGAGVGTRYYLNSTIYKLFLPLAIYRLLQRSATLVDLKLDPDIRTKYYLLKTASICFTDDFPLAKDFSPLDYDPKNPDWVDLRQNEPAKYWAQGLVIGRLEQFSDALIVKDGDRLRPMNFGEFEKALAGDPDFRRVFVPPHDVFQGFSFEERPILARILLAQAALMHLLNEHLPQPLTARDIDAKLDAFRAGEETRSKLRWWTDGEPDPWDAVLPYLKRQLRWVFPADALQEEKP